MARDTAKDLQRLLHEHPDLAEVWVTQKGEWLGIALTEDEAFTLISLLEPVLAPEADNE
jgi:hypothetical protein